MKLSKEQVEGINLVDLACSVYVSGLRLRETVLELYTDLEKVQAELADIHNSHKFIMDEKCSSQEKHCGCVPLLRAELTALKAANELQLQALIENKKDTIKKEALIETALAWKTDLEKAEAEITEFAEYARLNADAASGLNLALAELWELVDAVDYNSTNVFCNDISGRNWFDRRNDLRRE
uniref:Uncharacterized protein n=2 Tax=viral metagenome TaxID=1070528 RepID=A0A6M3JNM9_9ZZZZ